MKDGGKNQFMLRLIYYAANMLRKSAQYFMNVASVTCDVSDRYMGIANVSMPINK